MKKNILVIVLIAVFAISGVLAGVINYSDSEASEDRKVKSIECAEKQTEKAYIEKREVEENSDAGSYTDNNKSETKVPTHSNMNFGKSKGNRKNEPLDSSSKVLHNSGEAPSTEKAKHQHNWEKVYGTKQVEHTKQIPYTKCYVCNEDMTNNPGHIDKHLLNGESNVHYGTEYKIEKYYTEEPYVKGYECSCGAVK